MKSFAPPYTPYAKGHQAIAGAQLRDVTMDEAIKKLTESIHSYMKEGKE